MRIDELRGRQVLIVGCGATGASVARHLARAGIDFDACDAAADGARAALARALERTDRHTGGRDVPGLDAALARATFHDSLDVAAHGHDVLVLSPGIPRAHPAVSAALRRGATVVGDVELFAGVAGDAPVVAVTGSNGKSTVVAWLAHALRTAGIDARECGNIGVPALDAAAMPAGQGADPVWVLELSSYQLESTTSLAPLAAAVLNVSDDHLDRYDSIEHYAAVKRRVYRAARHRVANAGDARTLPDPPATPDALLGGAPAARVAPDAAPAGPVHWHLSDDGASLCRDGVATLPVAALRLPGRHNAANALAALALAEPVLAAAGADDDATRDALHAGLAAWTGLPHRTELVHEAAGVRWYDDSKGTNVDACAKAIEAMPGPIVLIMGGLAKGADFSALAAPVRERVRLLVLIGRDRAAIARALDGAAPKREADSLEGAVDIAREAARPGDAVLLSPACASFDMFRNFEERGMRFAAAARAEVAA